MKDFNRMVVCNDGVHTPLVREKMVDIKVPDDITVKKCYTYGKIIKLEHNGENTEFSLQPMRIPRLRTGLFTEAMMTETAGKNFLRSPILSIPIASPDISRI
jgi:hypothetical protein